MGEDEPRLCPTDKADCGERPDGDCLDSSHDAARKLLSKTCSETLDPDSVESEACCDTSSTNSGLSTGAIVGIVIGCVLVIVLIIAVIVVAIKKSSLRDDAADNDFEMVVPHGI